MNDCGMKMSELAKKKGVEFLVLGCAQLGLPYGVANRTGQPDVGCANEILACAFESGLRVLDTAAAYGESEVVLGRAGVSHWKVITKIPALKHIPDEKVAQAVRERTFRSLERLRLESLHAVLAHDHNDLVGDRGQRFCDALLGLQSEGLFDLCGVSVYAPGDLQDSMLESADIVQAPANVLDQRFITSGMAQKIRDRGQQFHVRSLFLQGLLLMPAADRPEYFRPWSHELERFDAHVAETGLDPLSFCLEYVARQSQVDRCVVGLERPDQIIQIVEAFKKGQEASNDVFASMENLFCDAIELIDPRYWNIFR